MDIQTATLVILILCFVGMAGILVVLVLLIRQWKRLIKILEEKAMKK